MKFKETKISDLIIIEPTVFGDERGYFFERYNKRKLSEIFISSEFVQDNESSSSYGVLRGLHFQSLHPQGKLVRVIKGKIYDVAVDLRKGSNTFGKWQGIILSEENNFQFYVPEGFAHGFLVLSDEAEVLYKCTEVYYRNEQKGIIWNDRTLDIRWPLGNINKIILSDKDSKLPVFNSDIRL